MELLMEMIKAAYDVPFGVSLFVRVTALFIAPDLFYRDAVRTKYFPYIFRL